MNHKTVPIFPKATSEFKFSAGFHFQKENPPKHNQIPIPIGANGCLTGINFVFTGIMPSLTWEQLKELIEKYGGNVASNISGKTDVLIRGCKEVGPKKMQEAQNKGIQITDQEGLFTFISKSNNIISNPSQKLLQTQIPPTIYQPQQNISIQLPQTKNLNPNYFNYQQQPLLFQPYSQQQQQFFIQQQIYNQNPQNNIFSFPYFKVQQQNLFNQYFQQSIPGFNSFLNNQKTVKHDRLKYPKPKLPKITYKRPLLKQSTTKNSNQAITKYLFEKKKLQQQILDYLDNTDNLEENYQNLLQTIKEQRIHEFKYNLVEMLNLIIKIAENHKRCRNFFNKIENLLNVFKDDYSKYFTNFEIFDIFKHSKRLLLFLIEEKIIHFDEKIVTLISKFRFNELYLKYFLPEFKPYLKMLEMETLPINFNEKRRKGENNEYFCQLIRNDSIEDFITYVKKTNLSLDSKVPNSIYETNEFLYFKELSLIEYSAFYGSSQIFKYLYKNGASLTPSLWLFAVHGDNQEIFHILDENQIEPEDATFEECYNEAVKCHHNHIANYIEKNFLKIESELKNDFLIQYISNYNFLFIEEDSINLKNAFFYFCCYDYFYVVNELLKNENIEVNSIIINRYRYDDRKGKYHELIETALNSSIYNGNFEVAKLLLKQKDIDVNIPSIIRQSSVDWELSNLTRDVVYEDIKTALIFSIEKENIEIIRLLLSISTIDVNLQYEIKEIELCDKYVDEETYGMVQGVNTFEQGTSLTRAIQQGCIEIIQLLLNHEKTDPNYLSLYIFDDFHGDGNDTFRRIEEPALNMAISSEKDEEIVKLILKNNKTDPNIRTNKYLDYKNNFTDDEIELNEMENINCYDMESDEIIKSSFSALNIAIENGNVGMVRLLLECKKIDINQKSFSDRYIPHEEKSPLFGAVENENIDIVKILLEQKNIDVGLKCNCRTKEMTALDIANEKGDSEIISLLTKK